MVLELFDPTRASECMAKPGRSHPGLAVDGSACGRSGHRGWCLPWGLVRLDRLACSVE